MRIMVDSNIIISAALFPESVVGKVLFHIAKNHKLVLCQHILDELSNVFKKKFPKRKEYLTEFIKKLKYELIDINIKDFKNYPKIRDKHDIPVLANAIEAKVTLLITGDNDFEGIEIETPKIIKPAKYMLEYMN